MKITLITLLLASALHAAPVAVSPSLIDSPQTGGLEFKSLSALSFGPGGLLLVAEPGSASIVAIQTGDVGPEVKALASPVSDIGSVIAGGLWQGFGSEATFLAGAAFAVIAALGLIPLRHKLA